ncbi:MAG: protease inhibitor I42 family protein [Dehalococcoidia bacterium]
MKIPLILVLTMILLALSCNLPVIKQQTPQPMASSGPAIDYFYSSPACSVCRDNVTLTWRVTGADNITIDQGIGKVSAADNLTVSPAATTTYKLTARSGNLMTTDSTTVVVTAAPAAATAASTAVIPVSTLPVVNYFDTTPNIIAPGDIITLVWKTTGASSASIDNGIGSVSTSGRYSFIPYSTTAFTLTAANSSGTVTATVTADVEEPGLTAVFLPVQVAPYTDVQAVVGKQFTILEDWNNSDNYKWIADYYDSTSLKLVSNTYSTFNPPYRGVNGQEQFVFQALKAGDTKLLLSYYNVNTPIDSHSLYYTAHILAP